MPLFNSIASWISKKRLNQINFFKNNPDKVQEDLLKFLITSAVNTEWGKKYDYKNIESYSEYSKRVPINKYEDLKPYIDRLLKGENNILWNTEVKQFAKSSGTTSSKSKLIPVTHESLVDCHYKGGKDLIALYLNNKPDSKLLEGKTLAMGGSLRKCDTNENIQCGDVSAILMNNLPFWAQIARTPSIEVALLEDWEEKLDKISKISSKENVVSLMGVPSWTLILLNKIIENSDIKYIDEIWKDLEVFFHGGVSFIPYKKQFENIISKKINYIQTYNASEGFFGIQDSLEADDMLLMLDYGIFFEFIRLDEINNENPKCYPIWEVELNKNYAIVISTNAGLWRYLIGDTVEFTSKLPYRIKITGRTKSFINTFGEEVIEDNANRAIEEACSKTNSIFTNYTVAPNYLENKKSAMHEWVIEFKKEPENLQQFIYILDEQLKSLNSDYEAKRYNDIMLKKPVVHCAPKDTFLTWLKNKNKLGGQNKIPRLSNQREFMEELLKIIEEIEKK